MNKVNKPPVLICVVGARPNFIKIAPIVRAARERRDALRCILVHTGQHYDEEMKGAFFEQLGIPEPDVDLEVGSGTHAVQTAQVMLEFEPVIDRFNPFAVLVVGDVNSTIACALVAAKKNIPVVHVESGLRSNDRMMPEEINRVLTDQISELLFTTERSARKNLLAEGIAEDKIHFVGNVMIDCLLSNVGRGVPFQDTINHYIDTGQPVLKDKGYALLTLHRPSNVDDPAVLRRLLETIRKISEILPVVFPVHPRTRNVINAGGLSDFLGCPGMIILPPVGYLEMLGLMNSAKMVLTDSGGMQEETTALGVPCLTIRENTEHPITITDGTNIIVGTDPDKIMVGVNDIIKTNGKTDNVPEYWDGLTAQRIISVIERELL